MNNQSAVAILTMHIFVAFPFIAGLLDEIQVIILKSWHLKWELLTSFSPFFMVFVAFAAFVCWNGSIVLGTSNQSFLRFLLF